MIDCRFDRVVGETGVTALGGHKTNGALKTVDRMLVERVDPLGDSRCPRGLVTKLRRTGNTRYMTHGTSRIVGRLAIDSGTRYLGRAPGAA